MRPGISSYTPDSPWKNCHENFSHHFVPGRSWRLHHEEGQLSASELYHRATENMQVLIGHAVQEGYKLRAIGGNWSLSPVAMCKGGMIQTKGLDLIFNIRDTHLAPAYLASGKSSDGLKFLECGVQIARLNKELEVDTHPPRCIKASGGSNGQTIVGATATGTHGAALFTGAVHDSIVGLHIVTGSDTHVWLERESYPVASDAFIAWLGATPIRNDDLFNAAVVSFGSFGIIHGVMIETDPLFLLKEYRITPTAYSSDLFEALASLDFTRLKTLLPDLPESTPDHELYHMEMNMNPYTARDGNGMHIFLFYKVPVPPGYVVQQGGEHGPGPSPEFIWMMKNLLTVLGDDMSYNHIRNATTREFDRNIRPPIAEPMSIGTIFRDTRFAGNVASFAFAVETQRLPDVLHEILEQISNEAFAGAVAVRFVKGTAATLGFTRFPQTCVVELDGLDSKGNHRVFEHVLQRLEQRNIPFALHWGKLQGAMHSERMVKMYGAERLQSWKAARERLLTLPVREVFTNDFMLKYGLDTPSGTLA